VILAVDDVSYYFEERI